jgi:membrane fusion protein, adhesin transport system
MSETNHHAAYLGDVPLHASTRYAFWGMVGSVLVLILWASLARIDQVTRAPAQVVVTSRTQLIQSVDGGTITQIHVKEGDNVKAGDLLVTLQKARPSAAVSDSQAKVAALRITLARLEAEVYGKPLDFAPELLEYPEYIRNQTDLYNKRQRALTDDISSLEGILRLSLTELTLNRQLERGGHVSRADVLRLERSVADIRAQLVSKRNKYFQDAQAEMTKAQEDLSTQTEQLQDRLQVLEQTELRALVDGAVNNIRVNTVGGVLRPGDVVMELLPLDGQMLIEAKVSTADIAFVAVGQEASVKLDAYDSSIFGALDGRVTYISPDVLTEETRQGPHTYYRVHIETAPNPATQHRSEHIRLRPGLTASVDIKAKDRTVLTYLTKPIVKTFDMGLGER